MRLREINSLAILAVGCLAVSGISASAQDAVPQEDKTGSRFTRDKVDGGRNARQSLKYYGTCVAAYKSDKIEEFLRNPTEETWKPVIYSPNSRTRCAMTSMAAGFNEFAGTVSEGWYLREFRDGPPASFAASEQPAPPQEEVVARMSGLKGESLRLVVMDEFARCVAATAPMQVDALLRSSVESDEERRAIGEVAPYLGPCSFEGQNLSLDFESLRSMLSYALARRAVATMSGSN